MGTVPKNFWSSSDDSKKKGAFQSCTCSLSDYGPYPVPCLMCLRPYIGTHRPARHLMCLRLYIGTHRPARQGDGMPSAQRHHRVLPQPRHMGMGWAFFSRVKFWRTWLHRQRGGHLLCIRTPPLLGINIELYAYAVHARRDGPARLPALASRCNDTPPPAKL